jgi:cytochrome c oxidase subunit 2
MPETWIQHPASLQSDALSEVGWVLVTGAAAVFALTMALLVLALRRGPKRRVPGAVWLVCGAALPAAVLSALLGYSVHRTAGLDRPPANPLVISVIGRLWWWQVDYQDPATGRWFAAANELRLPAGRPVQIGLASHDVIHSLWVPQLGGKMDLVPGRTNRLVVTAKRPGTFRGPCAEFCGAQHARMAITVVVMPPVDFDRWLADQASPAIEPSGPEQALQRRGRKAFLRHCAGCHAVRGVSDGPPLPVVLGPDLTHLGSRSQLAAGALPNGRANLARWIADPQSHKPGARMPGFAHLGDDALAALAAYMESLK